MDVPVLDDQQELTYYSSVWTQDVDKKTYRERWIIGTISKKESGKPALSMRPDDEIITII